MGFYTNGDHNLAYFIVSLFSSVIGAIASSLTIFLIYYMKLWSGHILLVLSMSVTQLVYDITFCPSDVDLGNVEANLIVNILNFSGGISVAIFSNIMALVIFYIIQYKKSVDIFKNYKWFCLLVSIFVSVVIILYTIATYDHSDIYLSEIASIDVYNSFRLASIAVNFLICGLSYYSIYKISQAIGTKSIQEEAVCTLAIRMQYYPFIQALSRSGLTWYIYAYGFNFNPINVTKLQFIVQILSAILAPSASIGYFIIFLIMQPKAYTQFQSFFRYFCFIKEKVLVINESIADDHRNRVMSQISEAQTHITNHSFPIHSLDAFTDDELCRIIDYDYPMDENGSIIISEGRWTELTGTSSNNPMNNSNGSHLFRPSSDLMFGTSFTSTDGIINPL